MFPIRSINLLVNNSIVAGHNRSKEPRSLLGLSMLLEIIPYCGQVTELFLDGICVYGRFPGNCFSGILASRS